MSLLVTNSGGVLLAQARPPSAATADRWLIRLRWVAIAGILATILIGKHLAPALALEPLLFAWGGVVVLNLGWVVVVRARGPRAPLTAAQIVVDMLAVSVMLWFSGGASNPFAPFLTFHIVLAGLLCGGPMSISLATLALVMVSILGFAPPLPLDSAPLGAARVRDIGYIVSLASLSAFIGFFVIVYVQRVEQLRTESARNEKLAMLGRLVGAMSHELNTPLATILLAAKDLVHIGAELGSDDARTLAQTIANEAERASDVIGLVRGHVRPDARKEPLELGGFVGDFVKKELDRLGFTGERSFETTQRNIIATVPRAGLQQVLTNVLTNAVQATARTAAARIEVRVALRRGRVETTVVDNGPGIDPALLPRLGEPFQTTKGEEGGMGLGLYVSSILAERMDGGLAVDANAAGGTRVILTVPGETA